MTLLIDVPRMLLKTSFRGQVFSCCWNKSSGSNLCWAMICLRKFPACAQAGISCSSSSELVSPSSLHKGTCSYLYGLSCFQRMHDHCALIHVMQRKILSVYIQMSLPVRSYFNWLKSFRYWDNSLKWLFACQLQADCVWLHILKVLTKVCLQKMKV